MYRLMLVDDEKYAVYALERGIDWSEFHISEIFKAFSTKQAIDILSKEQVDLLITDIEMPGRTGIELAEWVLYHYPSLQTVFLTGHADFSFAQKAVQLNIHDYILKPVDYDQLKRVVKDMIGKVKSNREMESFRKIYEKYASMWEKQLPTMAESLWRDILMDRSRMDPEQLDLLLQLYELPLSSEGYVLPILISVERWKEELSLRDEEIMEYALRKASLEIILGDYERGAVIQDRDGRNILLIYLNQIPQEEWREVIYRIQEKCKKYIRSCIQYFKCDLTCYLGDSTPVLSLSDAYRRLIERERGNITSSNQVILLNAAIPVNKKGMCRLFPETQWLAWFEAGEGELLIDDIHKTIDRLEKDGCLHAEQIDSLYYTIIHMVYRVAHKKEIYVSDLFPEEGLISTPNSINSIHKLIAWVEKIILDCNAYFSKYQRSDSVVIHKVKYWIQEHYQEDLNRETIAKIVYLNPGYVSRLFRRETGQSLSDYILQTRMEKAKQLLKQTNMKVSAVAEAVGYSHFSHFAQQFKKYTGYTPLDYRRLGVGR